MLASKITVTGRTYLLQSLQFFKRKAGSDGLQRGMEPQPEPKEGRRERKRRETLRRIAETGLKLFVENGYDATTLESIAAASGIAARTFFYYFKTKDEIFQFWQGGRFIEALRPALLDEPTAQSPMAAVRNCLTKLAARYETKESVVVDRLLQSTEALRARKQAIFAQMEGVVFEALCERWPNPAQRPLLRAVAMIAIGTMRLAMESWREESGRRPLADYLLEGFTVLERQI
jgi:AcrR family transcriptional regulator